MVDHERACRLKGSEGSKVKGKITIKDKIVTLKRQKPDLNAQTIASMLGTTPSYVYKVWSQYVRREVKKRGRSWDGGGLSVPFNVHGWFFYNQVPSSWYVRCPYGVIDNRNRMKLDRTRLYTFCIFPCGSVLIFPFFKGLTNWKQLLRERLGSWLTIEEIENFMDSLTEAGRKEFAFHTPFVPKNVAIRIRGLGSFKTDTTPYPDGTTEFVVDPGFEKRLSLIEQNLANADRALRALIRVSEKIEGSLKKLKDKIFLLRENLCYMSSGEKRVFNRIVMVMDHQFSNSDYNRDMEGNLRFEDILYPLFSWRGIKSLLFEGFMRKGR